MHMRTERVQPTQRSAAYSKPSAAPMVVGGAPCESRTSLGKLKNSQLRLFFFYKCSKNIKETNKSGTKNLERKRRGFKEARLNNLL